MIVYPDYDESILSIISSILKYYGYDNHHKTLEVLDKELAKNYKNVVLMLFDGMGDSTIKRFLKKDDFLMQNYVKDISSVCPSTTACAIPTVESGLAPIEHAWLGWNMYFKEYDANITVLKNTYEDSNEEIKDCNVARKYIPYENVFKKIEKSTFGIVKAHDVSKYSDTNEFVYSCEEMLQKLVKITKNGRRNYIYTYLEEPDSIMHVLGVDHEYVKENVRYINSLLCELSENLSNTLIIITADHGLLNTRTKYLSNFPTLQNMLIRKPCFESRAMNFFVKEEYLTKFKREFEKTFRDEFILLSKKEVLERNMFGKGEINPKIDDFLGDYIAFAISDVALVWDKGGLDLSARHAGLTKDEMRVPLIMIDTNKYKK